MPFRLTGLVFNFGAAVDDIITLRRARLSRYGGRVQKTLAGASDWAIYAGLLPAFA